MYIDLLIKLKNAQAVKKEIVKIPASRMDEAIVSLLVKYGYLENYEKKGRNPKKFLELKLKYDKDGRGAVNGVKFLSRPSRRLYVGYKDIKPVKNGYGLLFVSTPRGIITGQEAKKLKVGGEMLFEIW
jgi:small subunit ribosomal protein S8